MPDTQLTPKEEREYCLGRALLDFRKPPSQRSGLAFEVSDQLLKQQPPGTKYHGGLLVPYSLPLAARAGLDTATSTKGAELKFTEPGTFIEALRNRSAVIAAGATVLDGLQGDLLIPRQTGVATAVWTTQNPGADVTDSNLTLDNVPLVPRELIATTSYSRQLLAQSAASTSVDGIVRRDLAAVHATAIDLAALNGSGSAGQPKGIINITGVQANPFGTNGLIPTYPLMTAFERLVSVANADRSTLAYVTTPEVFDRLRLTDRATTGTASGWFILSDINQVGGWPVYVTNNLPKTTTKGTSGATLHAIVFGAWSELLIGFWGSFEIIVDPFKLKKQGMIELTSYQLVDVNVRHPASFAFATDVIK